MIIYKIKKLKLLLLSTLLVLIDQFTKHIVFNNIEYFESKLIVPGLLKITLVKNTGAAFSLFSNKTPLLAIISFLVSFLLIIILMKNLPSSDLNSIGISFLLGGTLGNGIDRLFRGYVIDIFDLIPFKFPIFNVADISINIATICFILAIFTAKSNSRQP